MTVSLSALIHFTQQQQLREDTQHASSCTSLLRNRARHPFPRARWIGHACIAASYTRRAGNYIIIIVVVVVDRDDRRTMRTGSEAASPLSIILEALSSTHGVFITVNNENLTDSVSECLLIYMVDVYISQLLIYCLM